MKNLFPKVFLLLIASSFVQAQTPRLVVPVGSTHSVNAVAFSPDGKYVLTGSGEFLIGSKGGAILWDREGRELVTFKGHESLVSSVAFSPDGKYVLTGSADNTAKLWDLTGREIRTFKGDFSSVASVAFSPDGQYILTGTSDNNAILSDLNGKEIRRFKGHKSFVTSVAFSPDGKKILTGSDDFTARLWDLNGSLIREYKETFELGSVAFSPDGEHILTAVSDTVRMWNLSGELVRTFGAGDHLFRVSAVVFSPDGQQLAAGGRNGLVKIWDLQGNELRSMKCHSDRLNALAYSPDGKFLLTGSADRSARLWDDQGREVRSFQGHTGEVTSASFSPDGQQILSSGYDHLAKLWGVENRTVLAFKGHTDWVGRAEFSSDGQRVLTSSADGSVRLWNLQGQETRSLPKPRFGFGSAIFSPDGQQVLTLDQKTLQFWDLEGRELNSLVFKDYVFNPVFSPDGNHLLTTGEGYSFNLMDLSGQITQNFKGHTAMIRDLVFSPDGSRVVSAGSDKTARLWDLQGRELTVFKGHTDDVVSCAAFSPDGRRVVTGSWDNTVRLWDLQGKEIHNLRGHNNTISSVAFSPDGKFILSASFDHTIKVWDAGTGQEVATLVSVGTDDWVVTTPSGLFDASPGAMNLMYFVVGLEPVELDQLKERYYEPGLLARLLGISKVAIRDVAALDNVALFPKIEAEIREDRLVVRLTEQGGGLGKLSLFVNGKEVEADANPDRKTAITIDLKPYEKYCVVESNTVGLRAYNKDEWLKSPAYELPYTPEAAGKGTGTSGNSGQLQSLSKAKPHLYVISIGTSDYAGDQLDLRFPDLDAAAFAKAVQAAGSRLFEDRVHVKLLSTAGKNPEDIAGKANIEKAFKAFADQAKPADILLVYFSGHGITYGAAEKSQFYYLTKDIARADLSDPNVRKNATVSSEDLTRWLTATPALKQVMVLDACNSGKVVEAMAAIGARDLNPSQIRALDRMKDRTGMYILTGAAADKVSYEASQYGQGLLTYSLLQGMSGLALTDDKRVDVMTLFQYARDKVPELAKSIRQVQIPILAFPVDGSSFDIGIVDGGVKIPLAQPKPVFIRNVFQDEESFDDVLGLTGALADYFRTITARGAQAELIYVDVNDYENAYSIKGRYTVKGDSIEVRGRLFKGKTSLGEFQVTGKKSNMTGLVEAIVEKVSGML